MREQLAGDVLGADAATGFLVGGANDVVKSPDPVLTAQQRADVLHDMVSTTGSTFLGLTVGCARCHNHKFDPIPQTDYYALKAVLRRRRARRAAAAQCAGSAERTSELAAIRERGWKQIDSGAAAVRTAGRLATDPARRSAAALRSGRLCIRG